MDLDDDSGESPQRVRHAPRLLDRVDWRLAGMAAMLGPLVDQEWIGNLTEAQWNRALWAFAQAELPGLLILLFGALLLNLRKLVLSRPAALAVAVFAGCLVARAIAFPAKAGQPPSGFAGGSPSDWTVFWFFTRHAMLQWSFIAGAWYFLHRLSERREALRQSELARHHLDAQFLEARLNALRAQVEPHFLFNTLAHLKRLYKANPPLARRMLDSFCEYLRAVLPQMRIEVATLGGELDLARAYLDVHKIRMGERLAIEFAVPENERLRPFPPMMLISLVENAIKHGLNPLAEGGTVRVSAESSPDLLRVSVADSGRGFSASRGTGVGLANIRGRLAAMYGAAASMTLVSNGSHGMRATIEIPVAGADATSRNKWDSRVSRESV